MFVAELVLRKLNTEDEIKELENYLESLSNFNFSKEQIDKLYNQITKELFNLYDKLQRQRVLLKKSNTNTMVNVDGQDIVVSDVMEVLNTIEKRLTLYSKMINSQEPNVDVLGTIQNRRTLLEEYFKLINCIKTSDWSKEVD